RTEKTQFYSVVFSVSCGNKTIVLYWLPCKIVFSRDKRRSSAFLLCGRIKNAVSTGSFEELAMPLFDQLYNFAQWMTHNREGAEDLVQKAFAKALKSFPSFRIGTNFRAWMYRIPLRNTFLTSCTGLKATMTVPLNLDEDGVERSVQRDTPETVQLERLNRTELQTAIDELPVYFREILLLCEVEEMSYQEISETPSAPIGTVMSRLSRARRGLHNRLRPQLSTGVVTSAMAKGTNYAL